MSPKWPNNGFEPSPRRVYGGDACFALTAAGGGRDLNAHDHPDGGLEPEHRLDRHLDGLLRGAVDQDTLLDNELAGTLSYVLALAARPTPDPAFVRRLGRTLMADAAARVGIAHGLAERHWTANGHAPELSRSAAAQPSHRVPCWQPLHLAAAALVLVVLAAYLGLTQRGREIEAWPTLGAVAVSTPVAATAPVQLRIDAIGVNAPIERLDRTGSGFDVLVPNEDGLMAPDVSTLIPEASGPWVVAWRDLYAMPGDGSNVILEGHLDYWPEARAVFWWLKDLQAGDQIEVAGENGAVFSYAVDWLRRYPTAVDDAQEWEILGPTASERLTLITSAGEFDQETDLYPEILVVRAHMTAYAPPPRPRVVGFHTVPAPQECLVGPRTVDDLLAQYATAKAAWGLYLRPRQIDVPAGQPAGAEVTTAVTASARKLVACLNANDTLRMFGMFTDNGVADRLGWMMGPLLQPGFEWAPDVTELTARATPLPAADRLDLRAVENVRALPDGRVAAEVTIGTGNTGFAGIPSGVSCTFIFAPDDGYRIDQVIVQGPGTPTP